MPDLMLVKFIKSDRSPGGIYNPGDVAGFEPWVAKKLIAQGFAELHDCGKGPGKINPSAIVHLREPWEKEDDEAWLKRKPQVDEALARKKRGA